MALSDERRVFYADSSALVKFIVHERESESLAAHVSSFDVVATSRVAVVEVERAVKLANPSEKAARLTARFLGSWLLIDVSNDVINSAASLSSRAVRALDAIHLATAHQVEPDEFLVYDKRLAIEAENQGLRVAAPGAT